MIGNFALNCDRWTNFQVKNYKLVMNLSVRPLKKIQSSKSFTKTNLKPSFSRKTSPKIHNDTDDKINKREKLRKSFIELIKLVEFENERIDMLKLRDTISILIDEDNMRKLNIFVQKIFNLFDYQKSGKIDINSIKDCLYALNLCPTEDEYEKLLRALNSLCKEKYKAQQQVQQPQVHNQKKTRKYLRAPKSVTIMQQQHQISQDVEKKVTFDELSVIMMSILMCNKYKSASYDHLYDAFRTLDENNTGFILWTYFKDCLTTKGEALNDEELQNLKEFLNISKDDDKVYYKYFITSLQVDTETPKLCRLKSEKETEQEIVESFFSETIYY
jgi:Ca2+-binding EF-hand superfamily protein